MTHGKSGIARASVAWGTVARVEDNGGRMYLAAQHKMMQGAVVGMTALRSQGTPRPSKRLYAVRSGDREPFGPIMHMVEDAMAIRDTLSPERLARFDENLLGVIGEGINEFLVDAIIASNARRERGKGA